MFLPAISCIFASILARSFGSERLVAHEIVEETVFDGRADAQLHVGIEFQHGGGEKMRGGVAKHLNRVGILRGEDRKPSVVVERARKVDQLAVLSILAIGARDQGFLGEARRDLAGDFGGGGAAGHLASCAVRQSNLYGSHD